MWVRLPLFVSLCNVGKKVEATALIFFADRQRHNTVICDTGTTKYVAPRKGFDTFQCGSCADVCEPTTGVCAPLKCKYRLVSFNESTNGTESHRAHKGNAPLSIVCI